VFACGFKLWRFTLTHGVNVEGMSAGGETVDLHGNLNSMTCLFELGFPNDLTLSILQFSLGTIFMRCDSPS
jgi:hypothetical protein